MGLTQYEIASNYTTAIYQGGIVIPLAGGTIAISDQAVAPLGVFNGCEYVDSTSGKVVFSNYWPGSNNANVDTNHPVKAFVYDNPISFSRLLLTALIRIGLRLSPMFCKRLDGVCE